MPKKVAFLHSGRQASFEMHFAEFTGRLHEVSNDKEITIVKTFASDDLSRGIGRHAEDLALTPDVNVIVACGGPPSSLAAKDAVTNVKPVPLVYMSTANPTALGLTGIAHITGIAGLTSELDSARLELLSELLPRNRGTATIGVLNNGNRALLEEQYRELEDVAPGLNLRLRREDVTNLPEIEQAFAEFHGEGVDGVLVTADSLFNDHRVEVVGLAGGLPAIYQWREFAEVGGLMSFGPSIREAYALVGEYAGHILNGASAASLPIAVPDRFELVINLKTALDKGIRIPASLLSRATFVRHPIGP